MEPSLDTTRVAAGRSRARRLIVATSLVLAVGLAAVLTLLLVLQAPPVRRIVLERASTWARAHLGVDLRAGALDYGLLPPVIELRDVVLASTASPSQPFFTAERVLARLSWRALRGQFDIESLAITRPALTIARQPDGTSNLPTVERKPPDGPAKPPAFFIRELQVTGLDALIGTDLRASGDVPRSGATLAMRDVSIDLRSDRPQWLEGVVEASGGLRLDLGGTTIDVDRATASVAFDGRRVTVRSLEARAAGGTVDVTTTGSLDASGLDLGVFTVATAGGTLRGRGRLALQDTGTSELDATWTDVDVDRLARELAGANPPVPSLTTSGRATLAWAGRVPSADNLHGTISSTIRTHARAATGPATNGTLTATGAAGRWHLSAQQRFAGNSVIELDADARLSGNDWANAPVEGGIRVRSDDLAPGLADLRALGVGVPDLDPLAIDGPLVFDGRVSGVLADPRIEGSLSLVRIGIPGVAPLQLRADVAADRRRLDVERLVLEGPSARVEARGRVPFGGEPLHGTFSVAASDLPALVPGVDASLRLHGALALAGELSGTLRDPVAGASFSVDAIETLGIAIDRIEGHLDYRGQEVSLGPVSFEQGTGGRGRLQGRVGLDGTIRELRIAGSNLRAGPIALRDVAGAVGAGPVPTLELEIANLDGQVAGAVTSLSGRVAISTSRTSLSGHDLGPIHGTVVLADGVADLRADLASIAATIEGRVAMRAPYAFDARVAIAQGDLSQAVSMFAPDPAALPRLQGTLAGDGLVAGTISDPATFTARIDVARLDGALSGVPFRLTAPARLSFAGRRVSADDVRVDVGGLSARLDGSLAEGSALVATLGGPIEGLGPWLAALDPSNTWSTNGVVEARIEARRRDDGLVLAGQARGSVTDLTRGDRTMARDVSFDAVLDGPRLAVTRLQGTIADTRVDATASVPTSWLIGSGGLFAETATSASRGGPIPDGAVIEARILVDIPAVLRSAGASLPAGVTGSLSGVLRAAAARPSLEALVGELVLDQASFVGLDQQLAQSQPTRFAIADGLATIGVCEFAAPQSRLAATGHVGLAPGTSTDVTVQGDGSLRLVDLLVPGRAVGRLRGTLRLTGTGTNIQASGDLALQNASLLLPQSRFSLADWSGELRFAPDHLEIRELRGQLNGGDVSIRGRLSGRASRSGGTFQGSPDGIEIEARSVFLEVPRGLRSQADASFTWARTGSGSTIGGSITLVSATYREPVTRMLELVDALSGPRAGGRDGWQIPERLEDVTLDVRLASNDPAVFENSLGHVEMVPNLRLVGTLGSPALSGTIDSLDGGRLRISGRLYRLRESTLRFSPVDGLVPTLNVIGETRIGEYEVTSRITGTPTSIETTFTSDPPLPERDLRSLVVTGRTESAQVSGTGTGDSFAVTAASADVLGFAGQFVGLDSVRLGAADLELVSADVKPAQHLTVSKTLGRRFEIIVSENLEDNKLTWVFVWRPTSRYQVRVSSRENTEQAIEFRHEIPFGPGARSTTPRQTTPRSRKARVASVEVTGNPGFPREVVLSELKLTAGKAFDFRKWLDDRERLERFYRDQGYFQVRTVATRIEAPDTGDGPSVLLAYRIVRGPRTELVIEGADLPRRVIDEMKVAWAQAAVPDFLRADIVRVARAHLASEGYLRATLEATTGEVSAGHVRTVVRIDPGPRSPRRELAISGNAAASAEEVQRFVDDRDLDVSAWTDPDGLIRTIEDQYALRGYLRAKVSVDAPRFDGDLATLPVRIVEGPRAAIAEVVIAGVGPGREAAARQALGLSVGDAYLRHAERLARHRIEEHFRSLGYREAKAAVRTRVSDDGATVSVEGRVVEGPLYVVDHVKVMGIESANRAVVDRAITLEPGTPASQSAVTETRKRLYDTGIFRSADIQFEPAQGAPGDAAGLWPVDALVNVEEARRFLLRYGLEFSSEYRSAAHDSAAALGLSADLRDRNFLGRAITAGVGGHYEPGLRSVRSLLSAPRFLGRPILSNAFVTWRYESDEVGPLLLDDNRIDLTLEQRVRPFKRAEFTWGYSYGWREFTFVERDVASRVLLDLRGVLAGLTASAVLDFRDNPFDATRGWLHSSSVQWGVRALGSDLGYGKYLLRQFHYVPLGPVVLAGAARWGTIAAFGGQPPVTVLDQLFTAGGTTTVRGYREDELSSLELFGIPLGGTELLILNGEVRFPLLKWVKGVAFADAGNAFAGQSDLRLSDLAVGLGVGLRIKTPLAPIRLDLGFPTPRRPGDSRYRWHFSIGQMF